MNILEGLSSVCGEKPKAANKRVAEQCIANTHNIDEIVLNQCYLFLTFEFAPKQL